MKIEAILHSIDLGSIALPEFQRGYVWNREQVRGLMESLYRKHPVGGLLVWVTNTDTAPTRGEKELAPGTVKLLLDGQQRITSLYGIVRGKPPKFFDGNPQAFTGLYFNLAEETFEFYAPLKMKDNPLWINVTELTCLLVMKFSLEKHSGHVNIDSARHRILYSFPPGIVILIESESLFTSLRNDYSHAPESAIKLA